jgi:alanyl-tRNA synthetase
LELWNLVFMQFYRDESGKMTPLPKPSIDTGMGLERITAVLQGKHSNYDSDLFSGLINTIAALAGRSYGDDAQSDTALRVIADHCRATVFLVADGVLPSNEGRGYVLRRIMRRAVRFGRFLGLTEPFLTGTTKEVVRMMGQAYPHLSDASELLAKVTFNEEERFGETLDNGLTLLNTEIERLKSTGLDQVGGDFAFKLYDTYGFPIDIVQDVAQEQGLSVDEAGFAAAMEEQRQRSKKSWKEGGLAAMSNGVRELMHAGHQARFVGYETRSIASVITSMVDADGETVSNSNTGARISVFCPETPFYAEAGGQVGDHGSITGPAGKGRVVDTITAGNGLILHEVEIAEGALTTGDAVTLKVAEGRRQRIAANHTATHILHAALKQVLGDHVKQSGSMVTPERLRFDFTHFGQLSAEEVQEVERIANEEIRTNSVVRTEMLDREEAVQSGATALFGEKYDETVRVVSLGSFSKELCGGTHVSATGEIGQVKIVAETAIAAGVRRLEAVSGPEALSRFQQAEKRLAALADQLKTTPEELSVRIDKLLARQKEMEREVSRLTTKLSLADLAGMMDAAKTIHNIRVVAAAIPLDNPKTLREVGDRVRDRLGSGVAVLGGVFQDKVALLVIVSKDLTKRLHAGNIIKKIAALVGGRGGGRPDMAQAGGPMVDKLPEALDKVYDIVGEYIEGGD